MPRGSQSKRLQGLPPDTDEINKRARKPNTNSLEAFTKSQELVIRKTKAKKRPKAPIIEEDNTEDAIEADNYTDEPVENVV